MGIRTEVVVGTGIKFILNDEMNDLFKIVDFLTNSDPNKMSDRKQFYPTRKVEEENIIEMLEIFMKGTEYERLEIKDFGNTVTWEGYGIMIVGDTHLINKLISEVNLNKSIKNLAEVYIG